jgi:hypothetical protein
MAITAASAFAVRPKLPSGRAAARDLGFDVDRPVLGQSRFG